jgi:hypothetical protein
MSRRALRSTGSLRIGSPASALLRRAPTSLGPALASLALATRGCVSTTQHSGPPKFLGDPRHTCPGSSTPVKPREQASGNDVPTLGSFGVAFRAYCLVGFHDLHISVSNSAARVLTVYASWPRLPSSPRKTRFRLAALPSPGGNSTRWVTQSGFSSCGRHMASSWSRLSWRTEGDVKGRLRSKKRVAENHPFWDPPLL